MVLFDAPDSKIREYALDWAHVITGKMSCPLQKDHSMEILSCCKLFLLLTDMLLKDRWHDSSY